MSTAPVICVLPVLAPLFSSASSSFSIPCSKIQDKSVLRFSSDTTTVPSLPFFPDLLMLLYSSDSHQFLYKVAF